VLDAIHHWCGIATSEQIQKRWFIERRGATVHPSMSTVRRTLRAMLNAGVIERRTYWMGKCSYTWMYRRKQKR